MANALATWAARRLGAEPEASGSSLDVQNVTVDELDIPEEGKQQIRQWGKQPPPVPGNPPEWVDDEAAWERAKKAVEPKWGDYDEPWAVVAHVYKQMTGG